MRLVSLVALANGAIAQASIPSDAQSSVLMVLATALPPSAVSFALASPSAFAAEVAAELAANNPPAWYQALPADVKSLLPALYPVASRTPTPSSSFSSAYTPVITSVVSTVSAQPSAGNSTHISGLHLPTLSATASYSAPPRATANAASYPGAALGASAAAALGFLGMLAL
ncbi:hypothetical protein ACEQ8H_007448 [Pleosporales sp. CAS-2024a]